MGFKGSKTNSSTRLFYIRLSIGTVSEKLRGHIGLLTMISMQLHSYNWFANVHVDLEISVTICRESWCFCSGS